MLTQLRMKYFLLTFFISSSIFFPTVRGWIKDTTIPDLVPHDDALQAMSVLVHSIPLPSRLQNRRVRHGLHPDPLPDPSPPPTDNPSPGPVSPPPDPASSPKPPPGTSPPPPQPPSNPPASRTAVSSPPATSRVLKAQGVSSRPTVSSSLGNHTSKIVSLGAGLATASTEGVLAPSPEPSAQSTNLTPIPLSSALDSTPISDGSVNRNAKAKAALIAGLSIGFFFLALSAAIIIRLLIQRAKYRPSSPSFTGTYRNSVVSGYSGYSAEGRLGNGGSVTNLVQHKESPRSTMRPISTNTNPFTEEVDEQRTLSDLSPISANLTQNVGLIPLSPLRRGMVALPSPTTWHIYSPTSPTSPSFATFTESDVTDSISDYQSTSAADDRFSVIPEELSTGERGSESDRRLRSAAASYRLRQSDFSTSQGPALKIILAEANANYNPDLLFRRPSTSVIDSNAHTLHQTDVKTVPSPPYIEEPRQDQVPMPPNAMLREDRATYAYDGLTEAQPLSYPEASPSPYLLSADPHRIHRTADEFLGLPSALSKTSFDSGEFLPTYSDWERVDN